MTAPSRATRQLLASVAVAVAALLIGPFAAQAADVTTTADTGPGSLRDALDSATSGEEIRVPEGVYRLTSDELQVDESVIIKGAGASKTVIMRDPDVADFRLVHVITGEEPKGPVLISGVTLSGGRGFPSGGGILNEGGGLLTVANSIVTENAAEASDSLDDDGGGGIYSSGAGGLSVVSTVVSGNTASGIGGDAGGGGGIYNTGGSLTITKDSLVTGNQVTGGGGGSGGGGIYAASGGLSIADSTVLGNDVQLTDAGDLNGGGGIYASTPLELARSTVAGNVATVPGKQSNGGGGIFALGDREFGGLDISDSTISQNLAILFGTSNEGGGGIYYSGSDASITNSTLSDNTLELKNFQTTSGGGAYHGTGGTDVFTNVTVAGNTVAGGPGGGIYAEGITPTLLQRTVLAGNESSGGSNCAAPALDGGVAFESAGGNVESADTCELKSEDDLTGTDPLLGPLADNGGPTQTRALLKGSPAIDLGPTGCSEADQRGVARAGECDSGAYEFADTDAPDTEITAGPTGPTNDSTPLFEFKSPDDEDATFECRIDSDDFTPCESPYGYELGQGPHIFEVRAIDKAGNIDPSPASRSFTVDTILPDTTITGGPSAPTNDSTPTFTFTSNEAGVTFQCRIDGAAFGSCGSPHTTGPLPEGSHTFQVRAIDQAGNVDGDPASRSFTVDTILPDTTITGGPSAPTNDSTPTFTFTSNEAGVTFQCSVDEAEFVECSSPETTSELTDGPHTFEVRAIDAAGNVDGDPASRSFSVDTGLPDTSLISGPSGPTGDATPTFEFASDEEGVTFECSVDSEEFAECSSPRTTTQLADGPHTFEVRAIDPAGGIDPSPASRSFTVDTAPPDTTISAGPSGVTDDPTPTFTFDSGEPGVTFECRLDGAAFFACSSPHTTSALAEGPHTFEVRATDAAGNVDPSPAAAFGSATRSFTVQTVGPPPDDPLPPPVLGRSYNVEPVSGDVFVSLPVAAARASGSTPEVPGLKGRRFIPLEEARQVPIGSLLDTRRGTVRVVSARDRTRKTQAGSFAAGVFQVLQSRQRAAKGLTELRLKGSSFAGCGKSARGSAQASASRTIRRLRSSSRGRFRTRGRHSAATVRGTKWTTTDRCDGTLTAVQRGSVTVRDFRRRKNIVVKAGKQYLAKARR